ncbi:MAG: IS607 family transposase [Scytonematopsis contorta HA4267-MV1]|jgi:predicted site-specific integrase-resolvase|nr:IS607 family transposase [Scytonematopsis contorta HA4267-MV1]MBW4508341.1 IS607 family transposase [Scytonematopsis contorta HA4267-MV1]
MERYVSIGEAAQIKGVSIDTLRLWEEKGILVAARTEGGHRRYKLSDLLGANYNTDKKTVAYARVSSHDQKADLERQALVLSAHCEHQKYNYILIQDFGSGLNYKKKGLRKLIDLILSEEVDRLVVTNKDRLLRFGSELIFGLCEHFGVEVTILNKKEDASFEEDLASDVLEIITVFSARLYGSRSRKNQKIMENLVKALDSQNKLD